MTWAQHNLLPVSSLQHAIVTGQMKSHMHYRKVELCFHPHCRLKETPYHDLTRHLRLKHGISRSKYKKLM